MKTYLYIDGFNLYYGALKDTPYKWLNPQKLVEQLYPRNTLSRIKYFTAPVSPQPGNPDAPTRQQFYWRALRTLPNLEIIEGQFRVRRKRMKKVTPPPSTVEVFSTEEKGSDVILAAHLLMDGFLNHYDAAIVMSGDSDLLTPIQMVRHQLRKPVGVVNPQLTTGPYRRTHKRGSCGLQRAASFYRDHLTDAKVASSLFPETLTDATGSFRRPTAW